MLYVSPVASVAIRTPWMPSGSWSTARISGLRSVSSIAWGSVRGSEPMTSGEAISAHITSWVVDSSWFNS